VSNNNSPGELLSMRAFANA